MTMTMIDQAIHQAARERDIAALQSELRKGVQVDCIGKHGCTALMNAASSGCLEAVKFLVDHNAAVGKFDRDRATALHHACYGGNSEIVAFLLDNGADVNSLTHNGESCLMLAVMSNKNCVKLLLERKADTSTRATAGALKVMTALDIAKEMRKDNIVSVLQFAAAGAPPAAPPAPRVEPAARTAFADPSSA